MADLDLIVGISGKIGSGKTTLARALAVHLDGVIVPLAGAVKGAAFSLYGPMSFFPQVGAKERSVLQFIGHSTRVNHSPDIWLQIVDTTIKASNKQVVIIPDVRYDNEYEWIKGAYKRSLVVRLEGEPHVRTDNAVASHPSENSLTKFDISFDCRIPVSQMVSEVLSAIKSMFPDFSVKSRRIRCYVSGNIFGCRDFESKFERISEILSFEGIEPLVPAFRSDFVTWSERFLSSPLDASWERVTNDLRLLASSDALLSWLTSPSIGAAIEIFSAAMMQKFVIAIVPESLVVHPFLNAFAKVIAVPNANEVDDYALLVAIAKIKDAFGFQTGGVLSAVEAAGIADGNSGQ